MKETEFINTVLKPLYLTIRKKELVTEPNAEEEFTNSLTSDWHSFAEEIALKVFMYKIDTSEVKILRDYLLHIHLVDFNYFEE